MVRDIQRLMGCAISSRPAVPLTSAWFRGIQEMVLRYFKGTVASAKKVVRLTGLAKEEVNWWLNLAIEDCQVSLRSAPVWETSRLATDAMDTAVVSVFEGKVLYEELDKYVSRMRILHKEWLAFAWTVNPILESLKNRIICLNVDNIAEWRFHPG